ncbi:MAG: hypothetical protein EXQ87_07480 [Alphaproteobacteria bacterium]|nr:hypothetical protein [Alphaproteobacteria bacterium]
MATLSHIRRIIEADIDPQFPTARWRGASGRHYYFNHFPLAATPAFGKAVYILAHWLDTAACWQPLWIGEGEGIDPRVPNQLALSLDALHVHVHLLAPNEAARAVMVADIERAAPVLSTPIIVAPQAAANPAAEAAD